MKASPRQQQLLLDLQDLDNAIARLRRRRAQLPERAQLASLQGELTAAKDVFMEVQRELDGQNADIARLENDIETVRARRERDDELLQRSSSNKEVQALQNELETLARRQNELEDRELELMEASEATQARYDDAAAALGAVDEKRAALTASLEAADAEIVASARRVITEREGLAAEIERPLLEHYEKLRERGGIGAARLRGRISEASNMELAPAELSDILAAAPDEIIHCPQSGAILVRVAE